MRKLNMKLAMCAIIALLMLTSVSKSETPGNGETVRLPVEVIEQGNDAVGGRVVYQFKEKLRASQGLRLAIEQERRIQAVVVHINNYPDADATATAYAVVWNLVGTSVCEDPSVPTFVTTTIGTCGADRVEEAAEGLVAQTDKLAVMLRNLIVPVTLKRSNQP